MKKLLYLFLILFSLNGFSQLGVSVGFASSKAKISGGNMSISSDAVSGFGLGLVAGIPISEKFKLETGLSFAFAKVDGESSNSWGIPLTAKIYTGDSGFHLRAGLGFSSTMEDVDTDLMKKGAFGAGFGLGHDINENFSIIASYSTQLSDSSKMDGIKLKGSGFGVSLQYFF